MLLFSLQFKDNLLIEQKYSQAFVELVQKKTFQGSTQGEMINKLILFWSNWSFFNKSDLALSCRCSQKTFNQSLGSVTKN